MAKKGNDLGHTYPLKIRIKPVFHEDSKTVWDFLIGPLFH